jgi:hypothetical protein
MKLFIACIFSFAYWKCLWAQQQAQRKPPSYFPSTREPRIQGSQITLDIVNHLFRQKPHTSYSIAMNEEFQTLPFLIQSRLRRLFCQDIIHNSIKCILYLELVFSELTLSLPGEALVSASLTLRSILLELEYQKYIAIDKLKGFAYLTVEALPYVEEIRIALQENIKKKTYLNGTFCFHSSLCKDFKEIST